MFGICIQLGISMNTEITQDQQMTTVGGKGIDKLRELSETNLQF
jgi:hypothetical protein